MRLTTRLAHDPYFRNALITIMGIIGFWLIVRGGRSTFKEYVAKTWPRAAGVVQKSGSRTHRGGRGGSVTVPVITFTYRVDGNAYVSDRLTFEAAIVPFLEPSVESVVAAHPEGSAITVYYNPSNPREAVLEPGHYLINLVTVAIGALLLVASVRGYRAELRSGRLTSA